MNYTDSKDTELINGLAPNELKKFNQLNEGEREIFITGLRLQSGNERNGIKNKSNQNQIDETITQASDFEENEEDTANGNEPKNAKGAGRHRKECDCEKCVKKRAEKGETVQPQKPPVKTLATELSEYKDVTNEVGLPSANTGQAAPQNTPAPAPSMPKLDPTKFINGAILLIIIDSVIPTAVLFMMGFIDEKYKRIKPEARKKLKLDKEQRKELEEGANEVVRYYLNDIHPLILIGVGVMFMYYEKFDSLGENDFYKK